MIPIFNFQFPVFLKSYADLAHTRAVKDGGAGKRGFTLLYAVLASGLVLAVGLAVFTIAQKEGALSSFATESQLAIYSADTGLECGLHWDLTQGVFVDTGTEPNPPVTCAGIAFTMAGGNLDIQLLPGGVVLYTLSTAAGDPYCFNVEIEKTFGPGQEDTTITSDGFNSCAPHARKVQRTLQAIF